MNKNKKKVFVMMSGGVDSSVVAALLIKQGFIVTGIFMKNWSEGEFCTAQQDQRDARRVASQLGISFYVLNFEKEYKQKVFEIFLKGIRKGKIPNPDVLCNEYIKFGVFLEKALKLGADLVATGHYARIARELKTKNEKVKTTSKNLKIYKLLKGVDKTKDQSYFLYRLNQKQLCKTLFPLGEYKKTQIRQIAQELGLVTAKKSDSQGICFVGEEPFVKFLKRYIKENRGDIVDNKGKIVGKHIGVQFYSIGQRKGLGIGGGTPFFVIKKDLKKNELTIGKENDKNLFSKKVIIKDLYEVYNGAITNLKIPFFKNILSLLMIAGKDNAFSITAKIRYQQEDQVIKKIKILSNNNIKIIFKKSQRAVTSGQAVVIYNNGAVLGGGTIV